MKLINLKCETCGAHLRRTASMRELECEYCGSRYLGETSDKSCGMENQTFKLPVELNDSVALKNLLSTIKRAPFVHEDAEKTVSSVQPKGVMVPCYCFECDMTANWQGENSVDKMRTVFNPVTGTYVTEPYKEWYPQNGQHFGKHNVFVSTSGALKESESWGLFPLPVEKKSPFYEGDEKQEFSLEMPDMLPDEAWSKKGEALAKWMEEQACRALVEKLKTANSKIDSKKDSLIYAPVWIFNYKVDGIPYRNIVCGTTGKVVGELPTNFDKLFQKLRELKAQIDQKNILFLVSVGATVLLLMTVFFAFITGAVAYLLYQQMNKLKEEFDTYIATNKYNLCYYILKQRSEMKEKLKLGTIPGVDTVEKYVDEEEGGKIDNSVAKQLVEKYLAETKPVKTDDKKEPEKKTTTIQLAKLDASKEKIGEKLDALEVKSNTGVACKNCGKQLKEDWMVCPMCGTKVR